MELDPNIKAAVELNTFLSRMQVPLGVLVTEKQGKHICASSDLNAEAEVLEEVPLVSWPTADLTEAAAATAADAATSPALFFCFHCLVCEWITPPGSNTSLKVGPQLPWSYCPDCLSRFCGPTCVHAAHTCHALLCPYLSALRAATEPEAGEHDKVHGSGRRCCNVGSRFITKEALARCVGVVLRKMITDMKAQDLTAAMLEEDFELNHAKSGGKAKRSDLLVSQLFAHATAPFNRLISTADRMGFDGIDFEHEWAPQLQYYLFQRGKVVLDAALNGDAPTTAALIPCHQGTATAEDVPPPRPPPHVHASQEEERAAIAAFQLPAQASSWEEEVLLALLSTATLHTLLGQLALNAHAVNDFALFLARPPQRRGSSSTETPAPAVVQPFFVKGAGVYSLLSAFNHSCEPNMAVHNCKVAGAPAEEGQEEESNNSCCSTNHEITLVTTKPIAEGEEVCISYIPLKKEETVVQRRAQLKGYFFQCVCPRCEREEKGLPEPTKK